MRIRSIILNAVVVCITTACASTPKPHPAAALAESFADLRKFLVTEDIELADFARRGPFKFKRQENFSIRLSSREEVNTDLFLSESRGKSPLIIISHGNGGSKEGHRVQGEHLASWGMHVLVLQLPNRNQWIQNGMTIRRLVNFVRSWPDIVDNRFDASNILLAGHSFGGSAVSIAASANEAIKGVILLDPAIYDKAVESALKRIQAPVALIGADESVFKSKRRQKFFALTGGPMAEISVRGATHNDAQFPSQQSWDYLFMDTFTSTRKQRTFLAAFTASCFSIAATGSMKHAWDVFTPAVSDNILMEPKQKR